MPDSDFQTLDEFTLEEMGVTRPALEEIERIIGRRPTTGELSTLLAMWKSSGSGVSLYTWLKGQPRSTDANDYLYTGTDTLHQTISEPRVKECMEIARSLCRNSVKDATSGTSFLKLGHGRLLYLAGEIATGFLYSEYARKYLHINADSRSHSGDIHDNIDAEYLDLILGTLRDRAIVEGTWRVRAGGIFKTLASLCAAANLGFDILTCREVRMDSFLFGEDGTRYIVAIEEANDDEFLKKMSEAEINCCFLGRITKGRVLVDGMDFGDISEYR